MSDEATHGLKAENRLIVTKNGAWLQVEKSKLIRCLQVHSALEQEANLIDLLTWIDDLRSWAELPRKHLDDKLVAEALLTEGEDVLKLGD